MIVSGYAIKWDSYARYINGYTEVFRRGAFKESLRQRLQYALINHNKHQIIASVPDETLKLWEDEVGLAYEMIVDDSNAIQQIHTDKLNHVSITFKPFAHQQVGSVHEVIKANLYEISLTNNPCYKETTAEVRQKELDKTQKN